MRADATRLPIADNVFGAVLLLDVLEHVDDHAALAEVHRVLRPGGVAVITVPAVPWLWSYRDEAAGHLRRYGRRQLVQAITGARLAVLAVQYYQCLLFPLVAATRLLGRRGPRLRDLEERPSRRLNSMMAWVNLTEVRLGDAIPWPWGSSLVAVCRKAAA
jgi:SAM-dependent methyltransferase